MNINIQALLVVATMVVAYAKSLPQDVRTLKERATVFAGWYADPEIRIYDGMYWIYPTTSIKFEDQKWFDAWSSPDLIQWTRHPTIFVVANTTWAVDNLWAPTSIRRHGKYYLYFSANGLRTQKETAGLGVAIADKPQGPYKDILGRRLVDSVINNANPMDPDVFVDDDDQMYFYFGGTAVNVGLLNDDMVTFRAFPNGNNETSFREITPSSSYVEGVKVFKRNGTYYMMWSENDYGSPTYQVAYGVSTSPLGPFQAKSTVLQQNPNISVATGHNSVLNIPGTDTWYIVYHRRSPNDTDVNKRTIAYDRMYFNEDGTIEPVKIRA